VAHGANLRVALPCLAGEPDPGADLPTGAVAALHVHPGGSPVARLVSWPGAASHALSWARIVERCDADALWYAASCAASIWASVFSVLAS
jgi:hypothetical protein